MKVETMARILLSVFVVALVSWGMFLADEGLRKMGILWLLGGVVLMVLIWVPWTKLRGGKSQPPAQTSQSKSGQKSHKK
ncbi:MAG: hypothetical protein IPK16_23080 [Anaerolineales bacterium]|nr:hypothetical protein [Anaerolineales bacterium]